MANLSGQTIQSTYPGILNLNTATTGITSTPQAITDGYGNDTGIKIATNYIAAPNILNFQSQFIPDYGGVGFGTGSATNPALSQNRLLYNVFWDSGFNSYSALTYTLTTASTTSDVVTMSFYTAQYVDGYGIAPKDLIVSGISMTSTGTLGLLNTTITPNLSFSGYGGGWFIYAFNVSNANVTPTVRYGVRTSTAGAYSNLDTIGFTLNNAGTALNLGGRTASTQGPTTLNTVRSNYTAANVAADFSATIPVNWGFGLKVAK